MSGDMTDKPPPKPQLDKFRDLARELDCDDDQAAFDEKLKRLAKASRPKDGYWRVDFATPHGHRANFYPVGSDAWASSPVFDTLQQVEAWLLERKCKRDELAAGHWLDQ